MFIIIKASGTMSYLLNIDTSSDKTYVSISKNGTLLKKVIDYSKNNTLSIHRSIDDLLKETHIPIRTLAAIAVAEGPGSYTGLRVGMSTAKGLAYSLNIPLITINSLLLLAIASERKEENLLYCPMIDARRMEVFTALYNNSFDIIIPPVNMVLDENSLSQYSDTRIVFSGKGSIKIAELYTGMAFFNYDPELHYKFCNMSYQKYYKGEFSDLIYTEPLYIKPFYNPKG